MGVTEAVLLVENHHQLSRVPKIDVSFVTARIANQTPLNLEGHESQIYIR